MKQIMVVWSYWVVFFIIGTGLVLLVERKEMVKTPTARQSSNYSTELKVDKNTMKIEGKEWVAAKEQEKTPPLEENSQTSKVTESALEKNKEAHDGNNRLAKDEDKEEKETEKNASQSLKLLEEVELVNKENKVKKTQ
ncbi:MAG: hypothetical protein CR997_02025 [Acidobacteria bacterium]|nr:MAG: hypothetical protein CR997_02025 [Acidobacteriota bacterium]